MKKGGITRSTGFQVLLYFLLAAGVLCGCFCILVSVWLWDWGATKDGYAEYERNIMTSEAYDHLNYICDNSNSFSTLEQIIDAFIAESSAYNVKYAIYEADGKLVWSNISSVYLADAAYMEEFYPYQYWFYRQEPETVEEVTVNVKEENADITIETSEIATNSGIVLEDATEIVDYEVVEKDVYHEYKAVMYVDTTFSKDDTFRQLHENALFWYSRQNMVYIGAVVSCLLVLICFIWILCNAGHRWQREGICPGVLSNIYLEIVTGFFVFGAICILIVFNELERSFSNFFVMAALVSVTATVMVVWGTIYMRELALRFKLGKWWQPTVIYQLCRLGWKITKFIWKCMVKLAVNLPEIHLVVIGIAFLTLCEFVGIMSWGEAELFACWFLEKIFVIPVILYCTLAFMKLRKGSRALAQGDMYRKLDTKYLLFHFKEHGEDLNQIGSGISKAVEERLQSERLKTELITNVSHDLKTPLTSVINYADLLAVAAAGETENKDAQIQEYSEVLLRQSKRLKKLLEDLVEASKAATGNVELKLVPCELGVMLTQVAGEYEEKFEQKELKLLMKKPEEEIRILADGRQLWRVFENLMNNICKYAQEGSRVYLNMEKRERSVEVIFRNISKYEIDVSPEELTERFVRGDASRHMEGSGLGLSIAKSLVDLQNGTMEILTDGDLFKVILRFEIYTE
ncbi:MAG: sensor histidine kinase [Lachnospiraceae bacterium]|nr:sensor histidine kinase [Lachnospiraceae bacterium]